MTSELKPCPFCGGDAKHNDGGNSVYGRFWWKVWCDDCQIQLADQEIWTEDHKLKLPPKECFERWNTRAAPDVPELVRYDMEQTRDGVEMFIRFYGEYVRYAQAAATIAAKDGRITAQAEEIARLENDLEAMQHRAEEAEAKLAQINDQKPVAYTMIFRKSYGVNTETTFKRFEDAEKYAIHCELPLSSIIPLYAAPVASEADMIAENQRLSEALDFYENN